MNPRILAEAFTALTDEMLALKEANRVRRAELAREHARELAKMREDERELSAERAQIALDMTLTGHSYEHLGALVGVSGPFICQLARKAREENSKCQSTKTSASS